MLFDKVKHILCISLILLVGVTTLYACKSDDKELQGEPVLQVQKSIGFKKEGGEVAVPVKSNREWNASVTEGHDFYFRTCFLDPFQGSVMANFAWDTISK